LRLAGLAGLAGLDALQSVELLILQTGQSIAKMGSGRATLPQNARHVLKLAILRRLTT